MRIKTFQPQKSRQEKLNRNTAFIISNLQKDFHQDNLSFACLQFHNQNCLNILADNIFCKESVNWLKQYHLLANLSHESYFKLYH